ncbi:malate synthase [Friedmanniella endophytica]|uniref:Malate synthase n=1 Tax=Microlunatus kandeliicorticis TaxID=1759536 RepID=A0A7W3P6Z5_9ACTN|nr:malate synthase A [Microlunatus kandeliicorticis]MBA8795493.1 malate synthase [Microlunatus kandeliicorticis]
MSIEVTDPHPIDRAEEILTDEALAFLEKLHRTFGARRDDLVAARRGNRLEASRSGRLELLPHTVDVRNGDWQVAPAPPALQDRRVEMTGPASPANMAINALNSGAKVWLADLEDAGHPRWSNVIDSILNLRDAARGTLAFTNAQGKSYALRTDAPLAVVVMRPRGWHLPEDHVRVDGKPTVGALTDFGLHFFHLARTLIENGHGPYYYLPKMESHLEARLWNDVFTFAEAELGIEHGTVRATVLIETIPAAFEMEEILYELREHASGLNAGRWDYLFSIIKYFRDAGSRFVLVDRADITMTAPFMRAYTELLVRTCHKRGAFAMGGMAAFIPSRKDEAVNAAAFEKVRSDKSREAADGFDGSWVAHPDMVELCAEVFTETLGDKPNQLDRLREDVRVDPFELLDISSAQGANTEQGLRNNLEVALVYIATWLSGNGAVAIHNLMEDAATAEISRSQVWQEIHNKVILADTGETVSRKLVQRLLDEEAGKLQQSVPADTWEKYYVPAKKLLADLCLGEDFVDFLTLPAYELIK